MCSGGALAAPRTEALNREGPNYRKCISMDLGERKHIPDIDWQALTLLLIFFRLAYLYPRVSS
jgi:hypothetical protein